MLHCVTEIPAGWYPDPDPAAAGGSLRYWDGTAWTSHVHTIEPRRSIGPTTPDGEPLAGWWTRVLAFMIDNIIVSFVAGLASIPGYIQVQREVLPVVDRFVDQVEQNPEEPPDLIGFYADFFDAMLGAVQANWFWLVVPTVLIATAYWVLFLRWRGATPGKLMLGLRVRLRDDAGTIPWWSIAARVGIQFGISWAVYAVGYASGSVALFVFVTAFLVVWLIDPLWAAWDPNRQTLHDKVARTNVVRKA